MDIKAKLQELVENGVFEIQNDNTVTTNTSDLYNAMQEIVFWTESRIKDYLVKRAENLLNENDRHGVYAMERKIISNIYEDLFETK